MDDRDELLLCPVRAFRKYLSQMKQFCPGIEILFVATGRVKERVSLNMVISMAHASALEEGCRSLRVRAHEVRKVAMSLLFKRHCTVHQVLKAGI